ncbi:MAG: HAMP domain-containing protein [Chloroflexi bacterium]|nr:HAMP domain-containing protein [Chloroflexota bacterium]
MLSRLTTRLVLSHLLVIAISMTLLSFVLLSLVQGYFEQALQQSLLTQARLTAQALISSETTITQTITSPAQNVLQQQTNQVTAQVQNVSPNSTSLSDATIRLGTEFDTRVRVVDPRGIVQADSANTDRGKNISSDPMIAAALRGQEQTRTQNDWIFVAVPFRRGETIIGAVYLGQPMNDVAAVLTDMRVRLLVSAAVSLVLSALVGLVLARAIARPVRELTRAANQLAQGKFDYPLDARSTDELGELARAFRSMSHDLQHTLQARTDLVSNVSHELRTPLTAIKGLVETLRDGAVDDLNARDKFLASIEGETDRLIRLVNDLLILSRADSHALALRRESFDLTELAQSCADELAPRQVNIDVNGKPTQVYADPDRIRQVLVNLLDNAIRYSPAGETVRVDLASRPTEVTVSIQDRGPGIPLADQARVFERFYRADKSRARIPSISSGGGAGLGLSIAQTIVQAHGGHIELTSHEGQGTTVRFTLPAA